MSQEILASLANHGYWPRRRRQIESAKSAGSLTEDTRLLRKTVSELTPYMLVYTLRQLFNRALKRMRSYDDDA